MRHCTKHVHATFPRSSGEGLTAQHTAMESNASPPDLSWKPSPRILKTLGDGVHVWRLSLDLPPDGVQVLRGSLTEDEISRAGRYHRETDRTRFIVARGLLRVILARYLNVRPEEIQFRYNSWGKPYLAPDRHPSPPLFNLSHSYGLALCGLSRNRMVGVDLERVRLLTEYEQIMEQVFCPQEIRTLTALPDPMRQRTFFSNWTRKEAYIKALGRGLSIPLNRFDVSAGSPVPTSVTSESWGFPKTTRWSLQDLNLGDKYVGAVAVEGDTPQLQCWDWQV